MRHVVHPTLTNLMLFRAIECIYVISACDGMPITLYDARRKFLIIIVLHYLYEYVYARIMGLSDVLQRYFCRRF